MGEGQHLFDNVTDTIFLTELQNIERLKLDPHQLCAYAYNFRKHELMEVLHKRHTAHSQRGIWSDIRHYIGRLGSFKKAVRILLIGTRTFPRYVESTQVKVIGPSGLADLPPKLNAFDLDGVVRRMLCKDQSTLARELSQALLDLDKIARVKDTFQEDYSEINPRPMQNC